MGAGPGLRWDLRHETLYHEGEDRLSDFDVRFIDTQFRTGSLLNPHRFGERRLRRAGGQPSSQAVRPPLPECGPQGVHHIQQSGALCSQLLSGD